MRSDTPSTHSESASAASEHTGHRRRGVPGMSESLRRRAFYSRSAAMLLSALRSDFASVTCPTVPTPFIFSTA